MKASELTVDDMRDELAENQKLNLDFLSDEEVKDEHEAMTAPYQPMSYRQKLIRALVVNLTDELDFLDDEELLERLERVDDYSAQELKDEMAEEEAA